MLIFRGEFNAKAKLRVSEMENQLLVGKYGKNKANENKNLFIEFCKLHNLLQIPSLNINLVTKEHESHYYQVPFHVKFHIEIK